MAGPDMTRDLVLLNAADQPARASVERFLEVPYLAERFGRRVRIFAQHAREAHARDIRFALGHYLDDLGIERDHLGLLAVSARVCVGGNLGIQRRRHEIAHRRQIASIISRLQLREVELGVMLELRGIEAWRKTRGSDRGRSTGSAAAEMARETWLDAGCSGRSRACVLQRPLLLLF